MKRVFKEIGNFKLFTTLALLGIILGTLFEMLLPTLLSNILNTGVGAGSGQIFKIGAAMLVTTLLSIAATGTGMYFSSRVSSGFSRNMRQQIFRKVETFSLVEMDRFGTASLITRTTNDVVQLQNFVNMLLRFIVRAPVMAVGGILLAWRKNPALSKPLLVSIPLIVIIMLLVSRVVIPLTKIMQKQVDQLNRVLREKLSGIRVIRAFVTEDYEEERFDKVSKELVRINTKMFRTMMLMMPLLTLVMSMTSLSIVYFGGLQAVRVGGILAGDIIAVTQYVMMIMFSLIIMAMVYVMYPRAAASAARIDEVLDTEPAIVDRPNAAARPVERATVEFKDVTFTFPGAEEPALKNISFRAGVGETTAIIGSTGSGKSSILNLIPRFYDVTSGRVLVDGVDVREYTQSALREKIGYVPQRSMLFSGTIAGNIRYGLEGASQQQVTEAATTAQALNFITGKDEGFDAPVAQGATNLSGGQRQRLSIARALVREPEIYLFDDSFSALDFQTDAKLRGELSKKTGNSTVLLVAQRVSSILHADRILVLNDGELVGNGTHEQLMESCNVYREIVSSQFSEEEVG